MGQVPWILASATLISLFGCAAHHGNKRAAEHTGCARDTPGSNENRPGATEPLSYRNFSEARQLLDAALAAHARDAERNRDVTITYHGVYVDEGHYPVPYAVKEYPLEGTVVLSRRFEAAVHHSSIDGYEQTELCNRSRFVALADGVRQAQTNDSEAPRRCRAVFSMLPSEVLSHADQRAATLRLVGQDDVDGAIVDVISYAGEDGTTYSLYIDRGSHLLLRVDHLESNGKWGDVVVWTTFGGYQAHNGEQFPTRRIERRVGSGSAATIEITLDAPRLNSDPSAEVFTPPRSDADPDEWTVSTEVTAPPSVVEIAQDVYILELPEQDFKAPFVVFDDYVIAMEAPLASDVGERIIDTIKAHAPGKPIRYLLMSHHHPHYTGGVRAFIHEGTTLVTTRGNVALLDDYATQPRSIERDRLAREPRDPVIEVVDQQRVFEDAHHRVEVYDIGAWTNHTNEYLVYHVPEAKLLIEGDLTSFPASGEVRPASSRTVGLRDAIESLGLDVDLILQTWPLAGQTRVGTMADLEAMVDAAKPK